MIMIRKYLTLTLESVDGMFVKVRSLEFTATKIGLLTQIVVYASLQNLLVDFKNWLTSRRKIERCDTELLTSEGQQN